MIFAAPPASPGMKSKFEFQNSEVKRIKAGSGALFSLFLPQPLSFRSTSPAPFFELAAHALNMRRFNCFKNFQGFLCIAKRFLFFA